MPIRKSAITDGGRRWLHNTHPPEPKCRCIKQYLAHKTDPVCIGRAGLAPETTAFQTFTHPSRKVLTSRSRRAPNSRSRTMLVGLSRTMLTGLSTASKAAIHARRSEVVGRMFSTMLAHRPFAQPCFIRFLSLQENEPSGPCNVSCLVV